MKNVAVIGAGTMGNGIAHTFAQSGFKVQLIDVSEAALKKGLDSITKNLDRMVAKEKNSEDEKKEILSNITTFTNITEGVEYASLVIEAATENLDLKLKIFKQLDKDCPDDTILATNTSSISALTIPSHLNIAVEPGSNSGKGSGLSNTHGVKVLTEGNGGGVVMARQSLIGVTLNTELEP